MPVISCARRRQEWQASVNLWKDGEPTCSQILICVAKNALFNLPDSLKPVLQVLKTDAPVNSVDAEAADPVTPDTLALLSFLNAPFGQIDLYRPPRLWSSFL